MLPSTAAIKFLESLDVPEGPLAGRKIKLAPFQRSFLKGALRPWQSCVGKNVGKN
jgi:hypothetical protein